MHLLTIECISLKSFMLVLLMVVFLLRRMVKQRKPKRLAFSSRTKHPGLDIFKYRVYFSSLALRWALPSSICYYNGQCPLKAQPSLMNPIMHFFKTSISLEQVNLSTVSLKMVHQPTGEFMIEIVGEAKEPSLMKWTNHSQTGFRSLIL